MKLETWTSGRLVCWLVAVLFSATPALADADFTGHWTGTLHEELCAGEPPFDVTMDLSQSGLTVTGNITLVGPHREPCRGGPISSVSATVNGTVSGDDLTANLCRGQDCTSATGTLTSATAMGFAVTFSDGGASGVLTRGESLPPASGWFTTSAIPGFQFQLRIAGGTVKPHQETCLASTLCVSAAVPGRSEVFVRIVGPKPNGYLWPNIVRFSTSAIEVWIKQTKSGQVQYYSLPAASADSGELAGLFDFKGFQP